MSLLDGNALDNQIDLEYPACPLCQVEKRETRYANFDLDSTCNPRNYRRRELKD